MCDIIDNIKGVAVYQDDIIIAGSSIQEHDERLEKVLSLLQENGVKLNRDKCVIRKYKLSFLGHIFDKDGMSPDPEKIAAINRLAPPSNVTDLRRMLGMVNYLGTYIPNLATITRPLNDLLKSNMEWSWGPTQISAFEEIKNLITSAPTLTYYKPEKPIIVSADASSYGLGAVLLQEESDGVKPIAYASRTLNQSEKNYAQIEKECLASVWACEKFQRYLVGLESFRLVTDHKPLVPLMNDRDLDNVPLRCQRLLMRLMRFNSIAEHAPGKNMQIADTLSRHPTADDKVPDTVDEVESYIEGIRDQWPASDNKLTEIRKATQLDEQLQAAIVYTVDGWPGRAWKVPSNLRELYAVRAHLSVSEGLLLYNDRIVIPRSMQKEMLKRVHDGHLGMTKCRERARSSVWWQGIGRDIDGTVKSCTHCQVHSPAQQREPLMCSPLPENPWEKIGADLFMHKGQSYLAVVDYYSRYLEIIHLTSTTSNAVINKFKNIFARWGIPYEIFSDNGPQFSATEFAKFAKAYGFNHTTSSPSYPQANGAAERAVQTAKRILDQEDPFLAIMTYRATPVTATGYSPARLLTGREPRTTMPYTRRHMQPRCSNTENIRRSDEKAKSQYEKFYNRRYSAKKPLQPLVQDDPVRMRTDHDKRWSDVGRIVGSNTPRSYTVKTSHGNTVRRNRRHLMLVQPPDPEGQPVPVPDTMQTPDSEAQPPDAAKPETQQIDIPDDPVLPKSPVMTKCGRMVKQPRRLDL